MPRAASGGAGVPRAETGPDSPAPAQAAPPRAAPTVEVPSIDVARLRLAIARLSRRLRRHQLAGLTLTQVAALSTVDRSGPLRLSELAAVEGVAPSTLTRLVAALEDRGYVERAVVASDARASELAITPRGREVLDLIRQDSTTVLASSLASLRPDQLAALAAALPAIEQLADGDTADDDRPR
jgi:DNA-binding MarR family transcriptional regulator